MTRLHRPILALAALATFSAGCFDGLVGSGDPLTETRSLDAAQGFLNATFVDVTLAEVPGAEGSEVTLTCDDNLVERLLTSVDDGVLVLEREGGLSLGTTLDCVAEVSVPSLRTVANRGSGDIDIPGDVAEAERFEVEGSGSIRLGSAVGCNVDALISGSGDIEIAAIDACDMDLGVSGSGSVDIAGTADTAEVRVTGSGDVGAMGLTVGESLVLVDGSGDVDLTVTDDVTVVINGSGDVTIGGDPQERDVETPGSGDVEFE